MTLSRLSRQSSRYRRKLARCRTMYAPACSSASASPPRSIASSRAIALSSAAGRLCRTPLPRGTLQQEISGSAEIEHVDFERIDTGWEVRQAARDHNMTSNELADQLF